MANPVRSVLRTYARSLVSDSDSANYGVSDSDMNVLFDEKQHLYGIIYPEENITRGTVASLSIGNTSVGVSLGNTARAVVSAMRGSGVGPVLERKAVAEIIRLQNEDPTQGTVASYGIERNSGSATGWLLYPHPIPGGSVDIYVNWLPDVADWGSDAGVCIFGAFAGYTIARMVAVDCAMILGRFDRVAQIEKTLPERVQLYMKVATINKRPQPDQPSDIVG